MGVVWVHWLMARGQILKESLGPLATPYLLKHLHPPPHAVLALLYRVQAHSCQARPGAAQRATQTPHGPQVKRSASTALDLVEHQRTP